MTTTTRAHIEKLSPEETARMPEWRDRWIKIGLCTSPADRPAFEAAAAVCYRAAGLQPVSRVIWVDSPLALARLAPVEAAVADGRMTRAEAVSDTPTAQAKRRQEITQNWHRYLGGQLWAGWNAWVTFFTRVCGLDLGAKAAGAEAYATIAESACWWWPHREFIVVSERPTQIVRDERGRLHNPTGMAAMWPDGWGFHVWHGVRVPGEWIDGRDTLDPRAVLAHSNVEIRRAGMEIIGWDRALRDLSPRIVDEDPDPMIGTLLRCDLPGAPGSQFLRVRCGTGRDFVLPVPREMTTALEANAWTYPGLTPEQLRLMQART